MEMAFCPEFLEFLCMYEDSGGLMALSSGCPQHVMHARHPGKNHSYRNYHGSKERQFLICLRFVRLHFLVLTVFTFDENISVRRLYHGFGEKKTQLLSCLHLDSDMIDRANV